MRQSKTLKKSRKIFIGHKLSLILSDFLSIRSSSARFVDRLDLNLYCWLGNKLLVITYSNK